MNQFQLFKNVVHIQQSVRIAKFCKKLVAKLAHACWSTFQRTKISMGNFQVCDALSILFELEKPPIEHLEGFILLSREGGELKNFFLIENSSSRIRKNSPIGLIKVGALMVRGMFAVAAMNC
jgi:hypothetical protein